MISLSGVGDTLMATPLLHELKENYPDSIIDVLVMWESSKNILKENPNINEVFGFNMIREGFYKTGKFCRELRKRGYDISINTYPQSKIQYRIVAKLIEAKLRLSHKYANWGILDNFLVNKTIEEDYSKTCSENNLNLLKLLDKEQKLKKYEYEIFLTKEEKKRAEEYAKENDLKNKILIGFHIGSSSTKNLALRRWPLENYMELSKKLLNLDKNIGILLFGKDEEKENEIISKIDEKRIHVVKTEDIIDTALIIKKCDLFLSVDTSLMHIASAVRVKKQIVIDTPTFNRTVYPRKDFILIKNPGITKDKLEYYKYDGKPINADKEEMKKIMSSISVNNVFEEMKKIL